MGEKKYQNIKIEKLAGSRVKISGEVTAAVFERFRSTTLEQLKSTAKIAGFRTGKAPEALVKKQVGEMAVLEQAAEAAINGVYGEIIEEHGIRAIGLPAVSITKIAAGNPLGFVLETAVMPEISLANYREISALAAAEIPDAAPTVEEKEIDSVIEDLRKRTATETGEEKIGALTDTEFAKKFGDFADLVSFRRKIGEDLIEHKRHETIEKRRNAIAEKLIAEAKFEVPEIFIESELDTMVGRFRADVERSGLTFEKYLTSVKKKESDIRNEWREGAERRARFELILKHIAGAEKIAPNEEEIKKEVERILAGHPGADRFSIRMYVENLLKNKLVLEFLETPRKGVKS